METAIKPALKLVYNGKDITADLEPFLIETTYTDKVTGQADELDIMLMDHDGRWMDGWYPQKGAEVEYEYGYSHQKLVSAGKFNVDEVELNGPPTTVRIRALAAGLQSQARTRKGKAYENTSLKALIDKVAKRLKATVSGAVADIKIPKATQYQETDWAFLVRICREYGYQVSLKDNNKTLVVLKLTGLDAGPVRTLRPSDVTSWQYRDKITEVAAKTEVKHHDHRKKKLVKGEAKSKHSETASDTRKKVVPAKTPAQAQAIAKAEQERHDVDKTSFEISLPGDSTLVAGAEVVIADWGKLSGTYLINEAKHPINKSSGFATTIQLKRIKEPT